MVEFEEHTSPDGLLKLAIKPNSDGDIVIGFQGFAWHTHADILASIKSTNETEAVHEFIDDILNDRSLVAFLDIDGETNDVWVTDDPTKDSKYKLANEQIRFRYWSGREYLPPRNHPLGNASQINTAELNDETESR